MSPDDQRRRNLKRATEIRTYRAKLKRRLAGGELKLSEVLRSEDPLLSTMLVRHLLVAIPGFGPTKARRLFDAMRLSQSIPLERLGQRRREEMLAWLMANFPSRKERF